MQDAGQEPFAFKFHWINDRGNAASMFRKRGRFDGESLILELALEDCSNYVPAYQCLKALYLELGQAEELAELERIWSVDNEDEQDQASTTEAEMA